MTVHYHGTPITPRSVLYDLAGRCFFVSYAAPGDVAICHQLGESVGLDNGAFSFWRAGKPTNWPGYYAWVEPWLDYPTTWAVIPDVIEADEDIQDTLIAEWPHGENGAPVWHMHERIDRLVRLTEEWPRVCIGSSAQYAVVLSPAWQRRMDDAWDAIARRHTRTPAIHMLRGMQCVGKRWPFASVDSTDVARNHNRPQNTARQMAQRWGGINCPGKWTPAETFSQLEMLA